MAAVSFNVRKAKLVSCISTAIMDDGYRNLEEGLRLSF